MTEVISVCARTFVGYYCENDLDVHSPIRVIEGGGSRGDGDSVHQDTTAMLVELHDYCNWLCFV